MEYFDKGKKLTCFKCGRQEVANICCSIGHYVCDKCHGQGVIDLVKDYVLSCESKNPLEIAETLMGYDDQVPMLGCENAWIAAGALIAAIRNEESITVTEDQILEVLSRTTRQAIGGYCGLTGVCGIAVAIGACFSVLHGAACPKDQETATTMKVVAKMVNTIANETGPCCCKNFVRKSLTEAVKLAKEHLGVSLQMDNESIICKYVERHPHGCRKEKCSYFG
ncbi:MAG: DUF5714 domain-containing protein [Desulfitobacterium hafniense]|nr:DUF5714 domain-containing protein [Desulfitobacterium hafniense]